MIPLAIFQGNTREPVSANFIISDTRTNLNLLELFVAAHGEPVPGDFAGFTIQASASIGGGLGPGFGGAPSFSPLPALRTGVWPAFVTPFIVNQCTQIRGRGGDASGPNPANPGGTAFLVECPVTCDNTTGRFAGGGGGGAGTDGWLGGSSGTDLYQAGGGGGAGDSPGTGKTLVGGYPLVSGDDGTLDLRGDGGRWGSDPNQPAEPAPGGGNGGDIGQPGSNAGDVSQPGSEDNTGGAAGFSVDGYSLVTWIDEGTLLGPTNG